jgi:Ca-activated chloride channel homolog
MEFLSALEWRQPLWLSALVLPFIWAGLHQAWQHKQQADYAEKRFWPWVKQGGSGWIKPAWLLSSVWLLLVIALAGPRWAIPQTQPNEHQGVDTLVLLDLSRSMSAQDLAPNRLVFAQNLLESLSRRVQPNDRFGLVGFGVQAHWASPLSWDKTLFDRALYLLSANQLPLAGSQLDQAIAFALNHLNQPSVVLLVTDSATADADLLNALVTPFQQAGHDLIVIGVGQDRPVFMPDLTHPSGWFHYENQAVSVPLERAGLQALAQKFNGSYVDASSQASLLQQLVAQIEAKALPQTTEQTQTQYRDWAWPFILLAALLLMLSFSVRWPSHSSSALSLLLLIGLFSQTQAVWAKPSLEHQAFDAFTQQDFERAERLYADGSRQSQSDAEAYLAALGAGNAAYRQANYARAVFWYRDALLRADHDSQRAQALYNLGNSQAQLELWGLAVEAYQGVLVYAPNHQNAQHNLMLVEAKLTELLAQPLEQPEEQGLRRPRQDLESAFRGGQSTGGGGDGDPNDWGEAQQDREGQQQAQSQTQQRPSTLQQTAVQAGQWQLNSQAQASLNQQQRQRQIESLSLKLNELDDDQSGLLKHLFEREAGFQARQNEPQVVEGVQPW